MTCLAEHWSKVGVGSGTTGQDQGNPPPHTCPATGSLTGEQLRCTGDWWRGDRLWGGTGCCQQGYVLVIGGGVTGCGVALDAVSRGMYW